MAVKKEQPDQPSSYPNDGWPQEQAKGSTFAYKKWERYKDNCFESGMETKDLRPYDYKDVEEVSTTTMMQVSRRQHPNDTVSPKLKQDLKLRRSGELTEKDPIWKTYTLPELAFALRRGSISLHVHVVHSLISRY